MGTEGTLTGEAVNVLTWSGLLLSSVETIIQWGKDQVYLSRNMSFICLGIFHLSGNKTLVITGASSMKTLNDEFEFPNKGLL